MAGKEIRRYVGMDDALSDAPDPYNRITASPVFSTIWGLGWLGYTTLLDDTDVWFAFGELNGATWIDYKEIVTYNDKASSRFWILFYAARIDEGVEERTKRFLVFLLNPPEDCVVFPVPDRLLKIIETYAE